MSQASGLGAQVGAQLQLHLITHEADRPGQALAKLQALASHVVVRAGTIKDRLFVALTANFLTHNACRWKRQNVVIHVKPVVTWSPKKQESIGKSWFESHLSPPVKPSDLHMTSASVWPQWSEQR